MVVFVAIYLGKRSRGGRVGVMVGWMRVGWLEMVPWGRSQKVEIVVVVKCLRVVGVVKCVVVCVEVVVGDGR